MNERLMKFIEYQRAHVKMYKGQLKMILILFLNFTIFNSNRD